MRLVSLAVMFATAASPAVAAAATPARPLVFRDVRAFDGTRMVPRTTVVVVADRIAMVGPDVHVPADAQVVDTAGKTLLPGLIDAHMHLVSADAIVQGPIFGVTTQLDMFSSHELVATLRRRRTAGEMAGCSDFLAAGTAVTCPGGHCTEYGLTVPTIDEPSAAQAFVDVRLAEGSDYIKIIYEDGSRAGVSDAVLPAVCAAARKRGQLVVVHPGHNVEGLHRILDAGANVIAHVPYCDQLPQDLLQSARRRGVAVIATLVVMRGLCADVANQPDSIRQRFAEYLVQADHVQLDRDFGGRMQYTRFERCVRELHKAGVPLLAGTDAPNPGTLYGASLHQELQLLVAAGISPVEALVAATSAPAKAFRLADRGRLAAGLRADLLLVDGDPSADIACTCDIAGVWIQGRPVDRAARRASVARERSRATASRSATTTTATIRPAGESASPLPAGSGLISDFEQDTPQAAFGAGWVISTDSITGGKSEARMAVVADGAGGTARCLEITGNVIREGPIAWAGAMFCPGRWPADPADLSKYRALQFSTRGDGSTYAVFVYAKHRGYMPIAKSFVAGSDWQEYTFPIADFEGLDGRDITAILFGQSDMHPGQMRFRIDQVRMLEPEHK